MRAEFAATSGAWRGSLKDSCCPFTFVDLQALLVALEAQGPTDMEDRVREKNSAKELDKLKCIPSFRTAAAVPPIFHTLVVSHGNLRFKKPYTYINDALRLLRGTGAIFSLLSFGPSLEPSQSA